MSPVCPAPKQRGRVSMCAGYGPMWDVSQREGNAAMPEGQDATETGRLLHRRDELVRRQEILSERVALFENPVNRRQLDELVIDISLVQQQLNESGVLTS